MKKRSRALRILMVEDDADLCSGWVDLFDLLGHDVRCYHRSLDALGDARAIEECDVVITDYYLPDLNGVELIKHFRERRPELPAILLTGSKEETVMTAVRQLRHCRVLHKPVNIEYLDQEIRRICTAQQAARSADSA